MTHHDILLHGKLPSHYSAQAAELIALTEACKLASGKSVNIYTDSCYTFGVVHDFGALWQHRVFLTSSGKPIAHQTLVLALLDANLLPKCVSVIKCEAHTNASDPISTGNAAADAAAKAAASSNNTLDASSFLVTTDPPIDAFANVYTLQTLSTPQECTLWHQK